jgi:hypothetical protein
LHSRRRDESIDQRSRRHTQCQVSGDDDDEQSARQHGGQSQDGVDARWISPGRQFRTDGEIARGLFLRQAAQKKTSLPELFETGTQVCLLAQTGL